MTTVDYILAAAILLSIAVRRHSRIPPRVGGAARLAGRPVARLALREPRRAVSRRRARRDTLLQVWVARLLVLIAVVIAAWLLGSLLSYLVQRSGLTLGVDRLLGALFGLVRGAVIVGFAVMLGAGGGAADASPGGGPRGCCRSARTWPPCCAVTSRPAANSSHETLPES